MTEQTMKNVVGNVLRIGVALAGSVVLAGGAWYLAEHRSDPVPFHHFRPRPGVMPWSGSLAMIQWGLLILIATPVARVVFSLFAFALEKDYVYVWISLIVLAILAYSLVGIRG